MRKFKLFSMLAMLLLCTAGMRAATEYGYGYFSARDKYPKAGAEISFLNSQAQDEGKLPGAFSVSATKKVWFSQGNLQYQASTGTWRFAENQWDKYANASEGGNQTAEADRATQEKWIDLFGFGTSGYDGKNPYMCSTTENNYVHENISGTNYDWGANAISNGGNTANIWRTLTYEEMKYLISERPNATNLMAKATISYGGIFYSGCMFLPDEWAPNGVEVYNGKTYFDADWDILVKQGAVFLPGGGFREGTSVYFNSNSGSYWTGTFDNYDNAWDFYFSRNGNPYWEKSSIVRGASVRLVSEIPHSDPTEYAALVTAPTPISGLKYNGEEQAWVTPGTATGGAIFYRIDQDGEWSYQTPTSDKAGTHTIYYKVIGDATHLSPEGIFSFEVKIEKGDITVVDAANCIPGAFTISNSGRKVFFSKGNLQYNAAQGKWRFAENQWDTIGAANANISESYNGWIDLFGRGTSGYNNSYPYLSSTEAEDYAAGEGSYNLTGEYAKYDWGIYNTEQLGDGWHLNSAMEISYLLDERSDPDGESWSGEKMRAPASINGINGIILLPDGITNDTVGLENNGWDAQYSDNALTLEQWQQLEQKYYAVFLPATGKREGTTVSKVNEYAEYWENSYEDDINGHTIWVAADGSYSGGMTGFARGCAVRLTCDGLAPIAIKGLEYNGNDQVLIEPGYCAYGTFEYSLNGEAGPWITELPTGLKPGEYTVHYRVIGDESHNDLPYAANRHVVTTITGAAEIMPAAVEGLIYNGAPQTLCTAGEKEGFTFQYKVGEDGEWSTELPAETNAGTYTVYYKATNGNVEEDITGSFDVTIAKAEPTFTKPTATEPTYTGEPQPLLTAGATEDGTFLYSLDGENWSTDIPTATNAGTYTVYYKVQGDADHRDSEPATITVTIAKATLSVEDVKVVIAKFADGDSTAAVTDNGKIIGVQGNDSIVLTTTASYDNAEVGENKTITVVYVLTADSATLANYEFPTDTEVYTHEGVIIEPMTPDQEAEPESEEKEVKEGIEINAFGFCHGEQYSLGYHLKSGNPNQYKITFSDSRFTPVPWTDLVINGTSGRDGYIDIDVPIDLPTGEYSMTVVFRDSIHFSDGTDMFLESQPFTTSFIVNLPETYTMPIFNDVIALVDTCHCLTDIQWYHRESPTDPWEPVPGATGYYLEKKGGLTGEYFAHVKMNGVETYTCPQTDVVTLYGDDTKVNVAPNPVISTATVTIENSKKTEHDLQITHLNGWIVEQNTFEGDRTTIDMSGCMVGQYMITVDGIVVKVIKK